MVCLHCHHSLGHTTNSIKSVLLYTDGATPSVPKIEIALYNMDCLDHECKSRSFLALAPKEPRIYYNKLHNLFVDTVWLTFKKYLILNITDKCVACRRKNFPKLRPLKELHFCLQFNQNVIYAFDCFGLDVMKVMEQNTSIHLEIQTQFMQKIEDIPWLCPFEIIGQYPFNNDWKVYFRKSSSWFAIMRNVYHNDQDFNCFIE